MFFELIIDFVLELLLENGLRSVSNRRIPFVFRFLLGFLFLTIIGGINLVFVWLGIVLMSQDHNFFGLILIILGSIFFLMFVKTLRAEIRALNTEDV